MKKNILGIYIVGILFNSSFWGAIWFLVYQQHTDYTGIAMIMNLFMVITILGEVPTGALGDLLGKKLTIIISLLITGIGITYTSLADNFHNILLGTAIWSIGHVFYSGVIESFLYDTLKEYDKSEKYTKTFARYKSLTIITTSLCTLIGVFLFSINKDLPLLIMGLFRFFAIIPALILLTEPAIDSDRYHIKEILIQSLNGIKQLFLNSQIGYTTILFTILGAIIIILYQIVADVMNYDIGFSEKQLGYVGATTYLIVGFTINYLPKVISKLGLYKTHIVLMIILSFTLFIFPFLPLIIAPIFIIFRDYTLDSYETIQSTVINKNISSRYRTTALSSLSMLQGLPALLLMVFFGGLMDKYSSLTVAFICGILLLLTNIIFTKKVKF